MMIRWVLRAIPSLCGFGAFIRKIPVNMPLETRECGFKEQKVEKRSKKWKFGEKVSDQGSD